MHPSNRSASLLSLFVDRVGRDGPQPALAIKRQGDYHWLTWGDLAAAVRQMAGRFRALGLEPGDRLVLVSENRYEWILCELAVHLARGVHVAVHCSLSGVQIAHQIRDSGARVVIVSGLEQARKLESVVSEQAAGGLPTGLRIASFDAVESVKDGVQINGVSVVPLSEVTPTDLVWPPAAGDEPSSEDLATILYTSGTTGEPKGVMLSHGNLVSNALACLEAFRFPPDYVRLCWLPLSHIYARTSDMYVWIAGSDRMALAESRETVLADCAAVQPTFINGVPYFYEKVARYLQDAGRADEPGALVGLLGGRMRLCCAGGAALPNHVAEFFARQGLLLVQGYGLTETSPVISTGTPEAHRLGTVGRPIPGVEVRIAADGEILCRGPNVMLGYWNKPEATAEVLNQGWFHTGDLGSLEDGYLRITGRKKELIVTAAGKNVAPTLLEGLLVEDPLIAQAVVVGDARNYLAALIVPDSANLRAEILRRQIPVDSPALAQPAVHALYRECIERRLADLSRNEQVRAFALLDRGFTVEAGELTPTLKIKRNIVHQHFAAEIEALYRSC